MKEKKPKVRIVLEADIDSYTWHQELVEAAGAKTKAELFWKLHEELAKQIGFKPRPWIQTPTRVSAGELF